MRQFARSVVRFARKHPGATLIAGDWNATPEARGRWSPHWIARKAGMHIAAPNKGTHGNRTIDFALVRDCTAQATREKRRGSDHHVVVFRVRP
jgi:endonuclease/exonuclease/phosphatase (EEP) superfamily protein YafD